jgi:dTDP-4-amino-4,6-dideoxygalactose transaminase
VTERLARTILTLPCYQTLNDDDIAYVSGVIQEFYSRR